MLARRLTPRLAVIALTLTLTAITTNQALVRYHDLRSGWSWDLAYYNQWFWAMTRGDGQLTVRPLAAFAQEGPSVWKMNYLAPIRVALVPVYALFPDPRTLLVIQNVIFWWVVPAAYMLVLAESRSERVALSAASLVPLTSLVWPLVWNDFRELQLALPFVLWAVQGWRERRRGLAAIGIVGMLACRQEFGLIVASLALLPPRDGVAGARREWPLAAMAVGLGWFFFAYLGYLSRAVGPHAPAAYLTQLVGGPGAPVRDTIATALDFLLVGLGSWAVLALFVPRVGLLALPWVWSLSNGRWALPLVATAEWHHVRYAVPMTSLVLAAGLVGYARVGSVLLRGPAGRWAAVAVWGVTAAGLAAGDMVLHHRLAGVPQPIAAAEVDRLWYWFGQVGPRDGVLAAYEVTAPLSSRQLLYSYRLDANTPPGYPRLGRNIQWAFVRAGEVSPRLLLVQGFEEVSPGPYIQVFRRHP